jgi:hypothetical protein
MTITTSPATLPVETAGLEVVAFDIYRDIHKGIRRELFGVTEQIGATDPSDDDALERVAERLRAMVSLLVFHAEHEDEFVQPAIDRWLPEIADRIGHDHARLEDTMAGLELLAGRAIGACTSERRVAVHTLYLGTASFVSDYLAHQAFEELEVMTGLSRALPVPALLEIDQAIVASIPQDTMVSALSLMFPAMNVDDRADMLGGMQTGAPPEVFEQVVGLAESVLTPDQFLATMRKL